MTNMQRSRVPGPLPEGRAPVTSPLPSLVGSGLSLTLKVEIPLIFPEIPWNYVTFYMVSVFIVIIARCKKKNRDVCKS